MPTPIFQVFESGGTTVATSHSFGQVKAGNESAVYTVCDVLSTIIHDGSGHTRTSYSA